MRAKLVIVGLLFAVACDQGEAPTPRERTAEVVAEPVAVAEVSELTQARQFTAPNTDLAELARTIQPRPTRAGFLRFTTSVVHDPVFADVFLERLVDGGESPEVRAALVEALPRTGGDYASALVAMLPDERDADVRVAIVSAFRRAPETHAATGIGLAFEDGDAHVRAEAARVAGARPEIGMSEALAGRLTDRDADVRAAAIRSLGLLGASEQVEDVTDGLRDDDAMVRLEAIRALRRLDPEGVAVRVASLTDDEHKNRPDSSDTFAEPLVRARHQAFKEDPEYHPQAAFRHRADSGFSFADRAA